MHTLKELTHVNCFDINATNIANVAGKVTRIREHSVTSTVTPIHKKYHFDEHKLIQPRTQGPRV